MLIFPFGLIATRKGMLRFTARSAKLVMAQWQRYGRDFGFDYGHASFSAAVAEENKIAAGWGRLAIRTGKGLVCTGIRWTPAAAQKIAAKEFRYISPALTHTKDGEITGVENAALTNLPATLGALPLTLAAASLAAHLPGSKTSMSKEPLMANAQEQQGDKHVSLAKHLMSALSALTRAAQAAGESDNESLKSLSSEYLKGLPGQMEALKAAFPHAEPDGDEGDGAAKLTAALQQVQQLSAAIKTVTGVDGDGQIGALLALKATADSAKNPPPVDKTADAKKALVDKMIKHTGQLGEGERETFLSLSMKDLESFHQKAPRRFPAGEPEREAPRTVTFGGGVSNAPTEASLLSATIEAARLLGLSEEQVKGLKLG